MRKSAGPKSIVGLREGPLTSLSRLYNCISGFIIADLFIGIVRGERVIDLSVMSSDVHNYDVIGAKHVNL